MAKTEPPSIVLLDIYPTRMEITIFLLIVVYLGVMKGKVNLIFPILRRRNV